MNCSQQALRMLLKIESESTRVNGQLQQARQVRLMMVLEALLKFKSAKDARKWLARNCRDCDEPFLHHVNSAHSTPHLMKEISVRGGD